MQTNSPPPANTLILPVSASKAPLYTNSPPHTIALIRRNVWCITPSDSVTVESVHAAPSPQPDKLILTIRFRVLTLAGNHVYFSPIDWTQPLPAVEPIKC